ncbi:MAG: PhoH family protein [Ignavibacteriales bacterium]
MEEKRIEIDSLDLASLFGTNDVNLKPLETRLAADFFVRGNSILIRGNKSDIQIAEKIFKEMQFVLNTSGKLNINDVETIIDLTLQGREIIADSDYDNIILYTRQDAIRAKTPTQVSYYQSVRKNDICFAIGPAGTGKTYLAVAFAVAAMKKGVVQRIILARPAVEAGESLGFLPGDFKEKIDPYLKPLYDALQDMLPSEQLKNFMEKGIIEIVPLAYMRGRTLNNAYVILDEAQNATSMQMKMFLTRLGPNSKSIITGDITQIDLPNRSMSGLVQVQEILKGVDGIDFIYFNKNDVVRHRLVRDIINAYDEYKNGNGNH